MKDEFKNQLLLFEVLALFSAGCHEVEILDETRYTGKGAGPTPKPIEIIGNGDRVIITTNTTWSRDITYFINGEVIVRGATLTIQDGTLIRGIKDPTPNDLDILNSVLIIDTDAQIYAQGTPSNPIVFTSDQPPGARNPGDWGGVMILGSDVINQGTEQTEGIVNPLTYGGSGDARPSGSGVIEYVRIEFPATILEDGNETNGLTLAGVSGNTTLNHIQVSRSDDDGFQFFGGSVNAQFILSWQSRDDDFDTELGHTGVIQYAISRRKNAFVSTESNGIESDNDGTGSMAVPETNTLFSNITFIGPGELEGDGNEIDLTPPGVFNVGALIRRNSAASLFNSIITAWPCGINLRDIPTAANYLLPPNPLKLEGISTGLPRGGGTNVCVQNVGGSIENIILSQFITVGNNDIVTATPTCNVACIVDMKDIAFATGKTTSSGTNPAGTPDFRLVSGSPKLANAVLLPPDAIGQGLMQESFRGAFDTTLGGWNFNSGWLEFDPQNALYH